jgi:hypothetical protein
VIGIKYFRVHKSKRIRLLEHVGHIEAMANAHTILVGKPEEKRPFRRPGRRCIISKCILKHGVRRCTASIRLGRWFIIRQMINAVMR